MASIGKETARIRSRLTSSTEAAQSVAPVDNGKKMLSAFARFLLLGIFSVEFDEADAQA